MIRSKGRLFVISAPSGAGKGTVIRRLLELCPDLYYSVSATTRPPREGEIDGIDYYFIEHGRFKEMIACGEFIEYAEYVGEYYGTPRKPIDENIQKGIDVLLEIEVQGARQVMAIDSEAVSFFIVPPSLVELERRLRGRRTESEEKLAKRLRRASQELEEKKDYDYIVVNDDVSRAAEEIREIINNLIFERNEQ